MKIAIVTGVVGGIGKASALLLAKNGYKIVGMDVVTSPNLSDFDGLDVEYISGDLSSSADRKKLLDAALACGEISARQRCGCCTQGAPRYSRDDRGEL